MCELEFKEVTFTRLDWWGGQVGHTIHGVWEKDAVPVDGSVFIDEVVAHVDACSVSYAKAQGRSGDSVVEGESPAVFARRGHDGLGDREFIGHDFTRQAGQHDR